MSDAPRERLVALDAMRGVCAIGVMCYHAALFLGLADLRAVGSYGVYTFFALSGFAMRWVYGPPPDDPGAGERFPMRSYAVARLARIAPLWWVALVIKLFGDLPPSTDRLQIVENITFAHAFTPIGSVLVGGWSIEVEVAFYLLFPMLAVLLRTPRSLAVLTVAGLALRLVTVEAIWPDAVSLAGAELYQQLPSFLVFFAGGMWLAEMRRRARPAPSPAAAVAAVVLLGGIFALNGLDDKTLLAGVTGVAVTVACLAAVGAAAWSPTPQHRVVVTACETLGAISYGTYLLHPLVYSAVKRLELGSSAAFAATIVVTLVAAWASHRWFEAPVRDVVRRRLASAA